MTSWFEWPLCHRRLDNWGVCEGSATCKGAGLWTGQFTRTATVSTNLLHHCQSSWAQKQSLMCCGKLCYVHVILQSLPSIHTLKLGQMRLLWFVAEQTLLCCVHVTLHLLPYIRTSSKTDISRALLAVQVAIKAAQLIIVTNFLPSLDIAFSTRDTSHVAHSTWFSWSDNFMQDLMDA